MAQLMLKQSKLVSRPHAQLDQEDPATLELEWHERHQFKYKDEMEEGKKVEEDIGFAMQNVIDELQQGQQEEEAPFDRGRQE